MNNYPFYSSDVITVNLAIQFNSEVHAVDKIKFSDLLANLKRIVEFNFKNYGFVSSALDKPYLSKLNYL
jgi:hypothetical protein